MKRLAAYPRPNIKLVLDVQDEWRRSRTKLDGPWEERYRKAQSETARAESELAAYTEENLGALVADEKPEAERAAAEVEEALEVALAKIAALHGEERRVTEFLRYVPGIDGRDLPRLRLDALRSEIDRVLAEGVPVPLPRSLVDPDADRTITSIGMVGPAD